MGNQPWSHGRSVGTFVGVDASAGTNALASIGLLSGLATSTDAQRFSCVGTGSLMRLTMDASAGLVKANNAIKLTNKHPAPINKVG